MGGRIAGHRAKKRPFVPDRLDWTDFNVCFPRLTAARHAFWVGSPDEGFGIEVCLGDEAVDGDLQINDDWNTPRLRRWRVSLAKKPSTALSQDAEVGVKWNVQRGCRASHCRTFGCLWVA